MALFRYMKLAKGPENLVYKVFVQEKANGRVGEPVGVVLLVVQVDHGLI